ncbi:MAG: polymer-forming cytoskeletal protein [Thermoanaerobaculia bacterium]|nr:polymer-forming cytoskeletal protein [Thermoanaerobaculia bacterium]
MSNRDDDRKPLKAPENRGGGTGRPATIGASIAVRGELVGREDLTIDGTFEGQIAVKGCLVTIGSQGQVEGEIHAKTIAVEGQVKGNLIAEDQVVVRASGKMEGDIQAPRVALDEGCQFKGKIDMEPGVKKNEATGSESAKGGGEKSPGSGASGEKDDGDSKPASSASEPLKSESTEKDSSAQSGSQPPSGQGQIPQHGSGGGNGNRHKRR